MEREDRERISWGAWRVADDGSVETVLTLVADDGPERVRRNFPTLEAAAEALGGSFREVVESVLAEGRRQGRWRP